MVDVIELPLEEGGSVWVEVVGEMAEGTGEQLAPGVRSRGLSERTTQSFESTLGGIQKVADSLHSVLDNLVSRPSSVTVEFGVKFSASSGVIIASGSGEANLKVGMAWTNSPTQK